MMDWDREPNATTLEVRAELGGREGLIKLGFSPMSDGVQVDIETLHGRTTLFLDDLEAVMEYARRYQEARKIVCATP